MKNLSFVPFALLLGDAATVAVGCDFPTSTNSVGNYKYTGELNIPNFGSALTPRPEPIAARSLDKVRKSFHNNLEYYGGYGMRGDLRGTRHNLAAACKIEMITYGCEFAKDVMKCLKMHVVSSEPGSCGAALKEWSETRHHAMGGTTGHDVNYDGMFSPPLGFMIPINNLPGTPRRNGLYVINPQGKGLRGRDPHGKKPNGPSPKGRHPHHLPGSEILDTGGRSPSSLKVLTDWINGMDSKSSNSRNGGPSDTSRGIVPRGRDPHGKKPNGPSPKGRHPHHLRSSEIRDTGGRSPSSLKVLTDWINGVDSKSSNSRNGGPSDTSRGIVPRGRDPHGKKPNGPSPKGRHPHHLRSSEIRDSVGHSPSTFTVLTDWVNGVDSGTIDDKSSDVANFSDKLQVNDNTHHPELYSKLAKISIPVIRPQLETERVAGRRYDLQSISEPSRGEKRFIKDGATAEVWLEPAELLNSEFDRKYVPYGDVPPSQSRLNKMDKLGGPDSFLNHGHAVGHFFDSTHHDHLRYHDHFPDRLVFDERGRFHESFEEDVVDFNVMEAVLAFFFLLGVATLVLMPFIMFTRALKRIVRHNHNNVAQSSRPPAPSSSAFGGSVCHHLRAAVPSTDVVTPDGYQPLAEEAALTVQDREDENAVVVTGTPVNPPPSVNI